MPMEFKLSGDGLGNELPAFIEHLRTIDPDMADLFGEHVHLLEGASDEEGRRMARARFNAVVKAHLLSTLAEGGGNVK